MRNLVEFPVTKEEIIKNLIMLSDDFSDQEHLGDMRPLLLLQAAQYVAYNSPPTNELGLVFLDYINGGRAVMSNNLDTNGDNV